MSDQIKAGDRVQLNSGGPHMTVSKLREWSGRMEAECDWFDGTKACCGSFPLTSLKLVTERGSSGPVGGSDLGGSPNAWMGR